MPTKREFAGFHKLSGERVVKISNPLGLLCVYAVEAGSGPYAGLEIPKSLIVKNIEEVEGIPVTTVENPIEHAPVGVSGKDTPKLEEEED